MSEKYIDIEQENCIRIQNPGEALMEIASHDIIFVLSHPDTLYDHESENMGQFCEVAYYQGDKIIWQVFNPGAIKLIDDFIDKLGDRVSLFFRLNALTVYLTKPSSEFCSSQHDLIYQNKYRFKHTYEMHFDSIFQNIDQIEARRSEMITSFQERGWKDAARIVKGYTDPVDINYAYKWYKKADNETTFWTAMTYD